MIESYVFTYFLSPVVPYVTGYFCKVVFQKILIIKDFINLANGFRFDAWNPS